MITNDICLIDARKNFVLRLVWEPQDNLPDGSCFIKNGVG